MLLLVAMSLTVIMALAALVVELSRLMSNASELQTLTDASALAGAYGLDKTRNASYTTIADSTASGILVEGAAQTVTYRYGKWDTTTKSLDTSASVTLANADAVKATATLSATHFLGGVLGTTNDYSIQRSAVAWMGGSVNSTSCLKPWAVPVSALKVQLGYPADDTTALTEADIAALNAGAASDTITIKKGSGTADGSISDNGTSAPGAFGAVTLGGSPGAKTYLQSLEDNTCSNATVSVGDVVTSEQGNIVGPTRTGICYLCNCTDPNGNSDIVCDPPYTATIIVYSTIITGGLPQYVVGYFGVFKITGYHSDGQNGQVLGTFSAITAPGEGFSSAPGPVTKLVLVQ
ncbi:MAG: Tad domain-containing protein [Gemmatimonadaceae bacterium]|nr:Tad domain-containing protein [Gemmatimonadaceae bacterium]